MGTWEDQVERILAEALEIVANDSRAQFIERACGGDDELQREVCELLEALENNASLLREPLTIRSVKSATRQFLSNRFDANANREAVLAMLQADARDHLLGRLAHFEVHEVRGQGAMGVVLKAWDAKLARFVAIKVLSPHLSQDPEARSRFIREARAMATVRDDGVAAIYLIEDQADLPYFVMEFIDGPSLREVLRREGSLPTTRALEIGYQIAQALAAAHAQGVVHRDIKPANILIDESIGKVKLTDFGLAVPLGQETATESAGTPAYMAPEQISGDHLDHRSDLFSLGCVLYAVFGGKSPFEAASVATVLERVINETPPSLDNIRADVPEDVARLVSCLLAKDPSLRPESARQVAHELQTALDSSNPQPPSLRTPASRLARSRTAVWVALIALVAGTVGTWWWYDHRRHYLEVTIDTPMPKWIPDPNAASEGVLFPTVYLAGVDDVVKASEVYSNGDIVSYWRPREHAKWGSITLRLEFPQPLKMCLLKLPVQVYPGYDPEAQAIAEVSADGRVWTELFHVGPLPEPVKAPTSQLTWRAVEGMDATEFDSRIRGQKQFWLRIKLYSRDARKAALVDPTQFPPRKLEGTIEGPGGRKQPIGPAYAQFLRDRTKLLVRAFYLDE